RTHPRPPRPSPPPALAAGPAGAQRGYTGVGGGIQLGAGLLVAGQRGLGPGQGYGLGAAAVGVGQRRALVRLAGRAPARWLAAAAPERGQGAAQQQWLAMACDAGHPSSSL